MIELLVVIAILAILAAILFPVFARTKAAAKQSNCISNLQQIGAAMNLYMEEWDDFFPYAVDQSDKQDPSIWDAFPGFESQITFMPLIQDALKPYTKSPAVFHCPSDTGTQILDNHYPDKFVTSPSMFAVYGSSYLYRTEITFRQLSGTSLPNPAAINVMFDGAGHWHGSARAATEGDDPATFLDLAKEYRYNVLFGDFHAKSIHYDQLQDAWSTPVH